MRALTRVYNNNFKEDISFEKCDVRVCVYFFFVAYKPNKSMYIVIVYKRYRVAMLEDEIINENNIYRNQAPFSKTIYYFAYTRQRTPIWLVDARSPEERKKNKPKKNIRRPIRACILDLCTISWLSRVNWVLFNTVDVDAGRRTMKINCKIYVRVRIHIYIYMDSAYAVDLNICMQSFFHMCSVLHTHYLNHVLMEARSISFIFIESRPARPFGSAVRVCLSYRISFHIRIYSRDSQNKLIP